MKQIFETVKGRYSDGEWHVFKSKFKISDIVIEIECEFKLDNHHFSMRETIAQAEGERLIIGESMAH